MEKKSLIRETSPLNLSITGKPLHIQALSESKSKTRVNSLEIYQRTTPKGHLSRLDKTLSTLNISKLLVSASTTKNDSKFPIYKTLGKVSIAETFELESGAKIYKCMSNPNVNGNSSTYGLPLRANTALNETQAMTRTALRKKFNTPKVKRIRVKTKQDTLSQLLQKANGICCKDDEDSSFKYFVGPGNNSALISRVMKSRTRWKRVYSHVSANFSWTALKNNSIIEAMNCFEPSEDVSVLEVSHELPSMLPSNHYRQIHPPKPLISSKQKLYNKLSENKELTSKKRLFFNMHSYYTSMGINPFTKIPLTFHVSYGSYDSTFKSFLSKFKELQKTGSSNVWIVKPGECTNRGIGINVCSRLDQVIEAISNYDCEYDRTFIIQKYIENPFLYKGRKFDIRVYSVISCIQGNIQGFFYKEGYLRTSAVDFNIKNVENRFIHLTNDAVQKHGSSYGKHEAGNKLSYLEFQEYLDEQHPGMNFFETALPQIKALVTDTVFAAYMKIEPTRKLHSFEVLGYDFMVDSEFKVWLIEVNTNPCLELSSPYLSVLIPKMLDNAFALTVDQLFPHECSQPNDFEMIFNEASLINFKSN
jgi:predicted nucleic acid-binding protein